MEKISSFNRFIDKNTNKETEEILLGDIGEQLAVEGKKFLQYEKEKTNEQLEICNLLNSATNKILVEYGLDKFDISAGSIHIIDKKLNVDGVDIGGTFRAENQLILIRDELQKLSFAHYLSHELIHFKSYGAIQVPFKNEEKLDYEYRSGFKFKNRESNKQFFGGIDEAITEELSKKIIESIKMGNNKLFIDEIDITNNLSQKYYSKDDLGDLVYVVLLEKDDPRRDKFNVYGEEYAYQEERKNLASLITKITEKNKYLSYEDVFNLFVAGKLQGNILPVSKLIENTFGIGTFRKIGELSSVGNNKDFKNFIDNL